MVVLCQIGEENKAIKDIVNTVSPRGVKNVKMAGFTGTIETSYVILQEDHAWHHYRDRL